MPEPWSKDSTSAKGHIIRRNMYWKTHLTALMDPSIFVEGLHKVLGLNFVSEAELLGPTWICSAAKTRRWTQLTCNLRHVSVKMDRFMGEAMIEATSRVRVEFGGLCQWHKGWRFDQTSEHHFRVHFAKNLANEKHFCTCPISTTGMKLIVEEARDFVS